MLRRSDFIDFDKPNKKSPQLLAGIFFVCTPVRSRAQAKEKLSA
jgi:hypothetical protein